MPQLGKALVDRYVLPTITQLNGIYLWDLPPRKYELGSWVINKGRSPQNGNACSIYCVANTVAISRDDKFIFWNDVLKK